VLVIDTEGTLLVEIPLTDAAAHLQWLHPNEPNADPILLAVAGPTIYTWTHNATDCGPTLAGRAATYTALAAAPATLRVAAASGDGNEVYCWDLRGRLEEEEALPPALCLRGFEDRVTCMDWNDDGRYLATSGGGECTVW
jgi:WD40 repeat protein